MHEKTARNQRSENKDRDAEFSALAEFFHIGNNSTLVLRADELPGGERRRGTSRIRTLPVCNGRRHCVDLTVPP
jgi:hypothetical protein